MWMWRTSIVNASDRIFPGLAYYDRKKEFYDVGNQIQSNLPLQMALYFNVGIFPLWFAIIIVNLDAKYYYLTDVYKVITIAVFIVISTLESLRLYLGYLGNLAGKIPELASFWLISTLIHFPLEMFLLFDSKTIPHLSETIANGVMSFLLITEIITATIALKQLANHHAKRFYIAQLYGIDNIEYINVY
ncbi:Transmembrane protein 17B [Formica fusca]|uniref:transmembrane protein 17B-like isoform X2 n=1 Tax=Formica exsecta TaxID=72781 RepID=UPI0011426193|nr:transmembrane protein 17B-like isoform X2 [Formica exsecta]